MSWAYIDSLDLQAEAEARDIMKMHFTEHESVALDARGAVPLAARSGYHGMVSLKKMPIIV